MPLVLMALWAAWLYPFLFRAPHNQKRPSITAFTPTRIGLALECAAIFIGFAARDPELMVTPRIAASILCGLIAPVLSWTSVTHLGKQFRVHAGLYTDHELVTTGPYGIVRHPIYSSLLAMLLATLLLWTPWPWIALSLALFIAGTEIRVRTEDGLLASRFGDTFRRYQESVPAYIPFVR